MNDLFLIISKYGYYFLFIALFLENTIFVGLVMPGETVLLAAAVIASRGYLNIYIVFIVACVAAVLGNIGGYFVGYFGGPNFLVKYGKKFSLDELLVKSEVYFREHGRKTVFIGRFAAGIRVFVASLAGASKMNFGLFFFYTVASVIIWTLAVTLLGFFFGQQYELILTLLRRFSFILLTLLVIFIIFYVWRRRYGKVQNSGEPKK